MKRRPAGGPKTPRLILNKASASHKAELRRAIANADEIWMAIGFLRVSGIALLQSSLESAVNRGAVVKACVGLSLSLTEPQAIRRLLKVISQSVRSSLHLCDPTRATFHPKLYCCRRGTDAVLFVGSANLTKGGLSGNVEASLALPVDYRSSEFLQATP